MDCIKDSYWSIESKSEGLFKDKGSKFISFAYPVETEDDVKSLLADIKKEYYDARHRCYAYRLGPDGGTYRMNDDGEPSSTAGRPILGQIDSAGLSDTLIVVVRYFGGIKLGVSGLITAYKTAAEDAIKNSKIVEKIATRKLRIIFKYPEMNKILKIIKDFGLKTEVMECDLKCKIEISVRLSMIEKFKSSFGYEIKCEIIELN